MDVFRRFCSTTRYAERIHALVLICKSPGVGADWFHSLNAAVVTHWRAAFSINTPACSWTTFVSCILFQGFTGSKETITCIHVMLEKLSMFASWAPVSFKITQTKHWSTSWSVSVENLCWFIWFDVLFILAVDSGFLFSGSRPSSQCKDSPPSGSQQWWTSYEHCKKMTNMKYIVCRKLVL